MSYLILLFIMLGSLGGIVFMLWRKLPLLLEMSGEETDLKKTMRFKVEDVVRSQSARSAKLLDTTLLKTRGFRTKAGSQTAGLVEKLRKKSEARKGEFEESYWEKLRKKSKRK